ncbi:MAG: MoaD/ThiS family protein [Candidatus Bathycorpusculaceae bacterium]
MAVTVKFVGAFRGISGKERLTVKIRKEMLLRELVRKIVENQPKLKRALIDPELEDPRPNALILVNGKEISVLNGLETVVRNGDEVVFVPVIHGG